jgi:hypothetical protein
MVPSQGLPSVWTIGLPPGSGPLALHKHLHVTAGMRDLACQQGLLLEQSHAQWPGRSGQLEPESSGCGRPVVADAMHHLFKARVLTTDDKVVAPLQFNASMTHSQQLQVAWFDLFLLSQWQMQVMVESFEQVGCGVCQKVW